MLTLPIFTATFLFSSLGSAEGSLFNYTGLVQTNPPNETRSISFKPFPNDRDFKDTEWTWRVNITDVPVPNGEITYPTHTLDNRSPNARGIVVDYGLSWTGETGLYEHLSPDAPGLCASFPYTISRLPNVTNLWPEENTDSPDCAPVLGQACVDAILATGKSYERGGCLLSKQWWQLPECQSTLYPPPMNGSHGNIGFYGTTTRGISGDQSGGNINDGYQGFIAYIYDGKDKSIYEAAVNMLQIVMLHSHKPKPNATELERDAFLACMRVKTDKLPVQEQEGGDNAAPGGAHVDWLVACGTLGLAIVLSLGI